MHSHFVTSTAAHIFDNDATDPLSNIINITQNSGDAT